MKFKERIGYGILNLYDTLNEGFSIWRFSGSLYVQWVDLFRGTNWTDFTFINLEVEHDSYARMDELTFALLGFCFTVLYRWDN